MKTKRITLSAILFLFITMNCFSQEAQDPNQIYTIVEKMPQYVGGDEARNKFINDNMGIVRKKRDRLTGTCYIAFVVEKDGSISNVKTLRGIAGGADYDEECLRVIKLMPNWIPGTQNGDLVRVQFNIPIKFK